MAPIEFWFDFGSPYSYFAAVQIEEVASQYRRRLIWRPFSLSAAFAVTGMRSLFATPLRGDYASRDWTRLSRKLHAPFKVPDTRSSGKVGRAFYWLADNRPASAIPFAKGAFDVCFGEGLDPGRPSGLTRIADVVDLQGVDLLEAIESESARSRYRQASEEAVSRGVFGAPFFFVDGEPFWGADRIAMIRDWLDRGGW